MPYFSQGDWFFLVALIVGAIVSLLASIRMFHRARLVEDMPTSKIRSASQGYVELSGKTKWIRGPEIHAPLTGLPCVWYSYTIEERTNHNKKQWRYIDGGVSEHLFLLEDETGTCVIDPDGATITPSAHDSWYGKKGNVIGTSQAGWHVSSNSIANVLTNNIFSLDKPYRYTERRLSLDEIVYAIGEFTSVGSNYEKDLEYGFKNYLTELKHDEKKLAMYDENQDGTIDMEEWEAARKDARQFARQEMLNKPPPDTTHLLKKPMTKKYQPFLISAKEESHISSSSRLTSYALATVFVCIIAGIFYKLFAY